MSGCGSPSTILGGQVPGGTSNLFRETYFMAGGNAGVSNHWYSWITRGRTSTRPTWTGDSYVMEAPYDGRIIKTILVSVNLISNTLSFYTNYEAIPSITVTGLPMDGALPIDGDGNTAYILDHPWVGATFLKHNRLTFYHTAGLQAAGAIIFTHVFEYDQST